MSRAVVLSAVRTPVGRYGGGLAGVRPDDLAAVAVAAAVERLRARGVTNDEIRRMFEAELAGSGKPGGHGE